MKQFFKITFASMLGLFLSLGVLVFLLIALASSGDSDKEVKITEGSILHIKLENAIQDQPTNNPFENIDIVTFEDKTPLSLSEIIKNIKKAKQDDKIKGIYLDIPSLKSNLASTTEIRNALKSFKKSGKFIVSYAEAYGQNEYYLASISDEIYLHPAGDLSFKGLSAQLMFFKDALDRLDIEMQVIRHGKYKSAIEPFIRNDMSEENKEQMTSLISHLWNSRLNEIADSRSLDLNTLNGIADSLLIRKPIDAKNHGLIDGLKYEDEILELLAEKTDKESANKIALVPLNRLNKMRTVNFEENGITEKYNSKNKVAVIFAEGEIVSGESKDGQLGSTTLAKAIKKARNDSRIKAIVLRVNSPGGSALASDVMWRELELTKSEKPIVVSMGDVAASGGYYISCNANKIFAEETTITGSIGVFGLIPNIAGLLENKVGVHIDRVNTNTFSDGLTLLRPMKATERNAIQEMIETVYSDFTQKVADGRGMSQEDVDAIGQGRVWTGDEALENGLVDEIGDLNSAIQAAAKLAELSDFKTIELPEQEDPFEKLIADLSGEVRAKLIGPEVAIADKYFQNFKQVMSAKGIYTRLPIDIIIE